MLPERSRLVALDGMRALAALVVVFTHATGAIAKSSWDALALYRSPLAPLLNATGAVHLFYVLSGYCLTASALRGSDARDVAQFYLRRIARIHGPYVAAALLAWLASAWLYPAPVPGVSRWMREHLTVRLPVGELLADLRFPGLVGGLLPQGWTLEVEMIFSLLMPFMVWVASRSHWAVLAVGSLGVLWIQNLPLETLRYAIDFAAGIAIFLERDRLSAVFARLPAILAGGLALAGFLLLSAPAWMLLETRNLRAATLLFASGATLLVAGAVHVVSLRRFLAWRPVAFLGRVSYSIYLLHFTVLALSTPLLREGVGLAGGAAFVAWVALVSCALAPLSYRAVELPCIRLGNAACRWVARRTGGAVRVARIES